MLDELTEKEVFRKKRLEFVTTTLREFYNLNPSSLDIIFENKADDLQEFKKDVRHYWHRHGGS